jgi:uncharacterized membrane protein
VALGVLLVSATAAWLLTRAWGGLDRLARRVAARATARAA